MIRADPEPWPKPVQFVSPVVQYARRSHHECTALEDTERFKVLPSPISSASSAPSPA